MYYQKAKFLNSVADLAKLPADQGYEVAFAGRSNVGKSSALNAITLQKSLAKTSKTPGRTQLINLFDLDEQRRLVDLPGYGYAKVSPSVKRRWQYSLAKYLQQRECLRGVVLLVDSRHLLKELDKKMIHWLWTANKPMHIILTKADKLSRNQLRKQELAMQDALRDYADLVSMQTLSVLKRQGIDEARAKLDEWFEL